MSVITTSNTTSILPSASHAFSDEEHQLITSIKTSPSLFTNFEGLSDRQIILLSRSRIDDNIPLPFDQMEAFYILAMTDFNLVRLVPADILINKNMILQAVCLNPKNFISITEMFYKEKPLEEQIQFTQKLIETPTITEDQKAPMHKKTTELTEKTTRTAGWDIIDTDDVEDHDIDIGNIKMKGLFI